MNPYVFIFGCPRSGTTMLERMVNAHPQIAIIHETHWITKFFKKRIGIDASGFVNQQLIDALTGFSDGGTLTALLGNMLDKMPTAFSCEHPGQQRRHRNPTEFE